MTDILMPPALRHARTSMRYIDNTGMSRGMFSGAVRTAARGGDRLAANIELTRHGGQSTDERSNRAAMRAFLASLRGRQNRAYLTDWSCRRRGSFSTGELLANNTFANGTTGWTDGSQISSAVADRIYRAKRISVTTTMNLIQPSAAVTVTQYAPYVGRFFARGGKYSAGLRTAFRDSGSTVVASSAISSAFGMFTVVGVPYETTVTPVLEDTSFAGLLAGDYVDISYASMSRCGLVDNGLNLLLHSDAIDNAAWTKTRCSITGTGTVAPDGSATAETFTEDTSNNTHLISQQAIVSSAAADIVQYGYMKSDTRSACWLQMSDGTSNASCHFNLATGAAVAAVSVGASWANGRSFVVNVGNGWYLVGIIARKTGAGTTITFQYGLANPAGTSSYLGDGAGNIRIWRLGGALSSVPVWPTQTTSTAASGTAQTGSTLRTKGWPASTTGLLLPDDQFEIITSLGSELKILTASVDSDAAGLAHMQFEPPLRGVVSNDAAIIAHQPMGRFIYSGESPGWDNEPGFWSQASCEFEEACV